MYSSYAVGATVCSVVFPVLATLAVVLRLRARRIKSIGWGADDYTIIVALVFSISLACLVLYASCEAGVGQLLSTMTATEFRNYQKHLYFMVILAHLAIGTVKISVLEFYKRIFKVPNFRRAANFVMVFVVLWIVASFFTQVFSAWPISNWWNLQAKYDLNFGAFITAFAAMDIVLDIAILCLPLPVIKNLQMSPRRKFTIIGIFWLGFFCVVAASVRLAFAYLLTSGTDVHPTDAYFSYVSVYNVIWSEIEPCASIVAACLPTFGPLIKNGISLQSLARSLQSHVFKRGTPGSSGSKQSASGESTGSSSMQHPKRWNPLEDDSSTKAFNTDIELGKPETLDPAAHEITNAKRAWNQQHGNEMTSDARHVVLGNTERVGQEPGNIRVEKTFAAQTEQR